MYASFFGLKQAPFSTAPDPRYLFMSERHREALAHLLYGVQAGGGFVLLTGEIGAGKTTVCRCFLEQVPADCQVGYIVNPKLSVGELLQTVAEEFGIPLDWVRITATNTAKVPNASPTAASAGSDLNGMAAQAAAAEIKSRMIAFAAQSFGVPPEQARALAHGPLPA